MIDLYYTPACNSCRSVLLTGKVLGIEFNLIEVDLGKGEHNKPEFVKINPQKSLPTIIDGDLILWESRAIMSYLAEAYGKNLDTLYPKLPKERALVHQRMYFDMGSLYDALIPYFRSRLGGKEGDLEKKNAIDGPLDYLNQFLEGQDYVAGAHLTLADLCAVSTVSSIEALDVDIKRFANVWRWYQLCQETIPGYEVNSRGADLLKKFVS